MERSLIEEFEEVMGRTLDRLQRNEIDMAEAIRIAQLPMEVRGYEDLKLKRAAEFSAALAGL